MLSVCSKEVLIVAGAGGVEHEKTLEQRAALGCRAAVVVQHTQPHLGQQCHCNRVTTASVPTPESSVCVCVAGQTDTVGLHFEELVALADLRLEQRALVVLTQALHCGFVAR